MEIFFYISNLCLLAISLMINAIMMKKINSIDIENDYFKRRFIQSTDYIHAQLDEINRSLLVPRENLETAKPIKSNNWDSVREAFKGPIRVEINERN